MAKRKIKRRRRNSVADEASYICDACGEEIVIPIDAAAGSEQEYVEDCPVCCRPNVVHVEIDEEGNARAWGEAE
jgi:DNA replicative helicase MCM subunit Mcm2 (Cdc46/Mcm family)